MGERVLVGERVERGYEYRVDGENERERVHLDTCISVSHCKLFVMLY